MPKKKISTFILVLSFSFSIFYMPALAPKTEAVLGFGDTVIVFSDITRDTIKWVTDKAAEVLAQELVDKIVQSTINWANTGFEGNPAYVTDPKQYFTDVADGVAGEFIDKELGLGVLCSPFQIQIRLALKDYYKPLKSYQCTLTDVIDNVGNSLDKGGWDEWFLITQNPANNPYGAFLEAQIELDSRLAQRLALEKDQLQANNYFRNWSECIKWSDPETKSGTCLERGPIKTPGAIIKSQIDRALPTGLEKLITVEHIDQLISAFATGLLKKYVFSSERGDGLFNPSNTPSSNWPDPNIDPASTIPIPQGTPYQTSGSTGCAPEYTNINGWCFWTPTDGGLTGPNNNGCVGTGCEPCSGTNCGVGKTTYGDPAINGVYAGSCRIGISASFFTSVRMTDSQCALVNKTISDGVTFGTSPSTGLPYVTSGGTYGAAIKAVALICGGSGGGRSEDSSASHYICGFP